ncbi:killer cell lectin-like receptor subfamily G member 1 [Polypterus senegalus]|uniref:killer cell lectin-like receptor subfamily G member 1 n=1 Tax=Polypterus senegalus TaxID=55291 RepID=UPI00196233B6|nr:killer cell lectin-like receptor subfamily G member 1 [Polypterus senegalus]
MQRRMKQTPRSCHHAAKGTTRLVTFLVATAICLLVALSSAVKVVFLMGKSSRRCPEKWMQFRESCFYLSTNRSTWEASKDKCVSQGGHLAMLQDAEEMDFLIPHCRIYSAFWIGLNRKNGEQWKWINGQPFNHTDWVSNNTEGNCVCVAKDSLEKHQCNQELYWVCKTCVRLS